jgi:glycine cleavage system H protein
MSNIPQDLKYTSEHEWARKDSEGNLVIGITDHAQGALGDIVFIELPSVGAIVKKDESIGTIESVKAVSDMFAPVSGKVLKINEAINDNPANANSDPYGDGWFLIVAPENSEEWNSLLSSEDYAALL